MSKIIKELIAITFALTFVAASVCAQVLKTQFPDMNTSTADGKEMELPADVKGKYTLLGLAFSKKSEDDLNSWMEPVFWKFIDKQIEVSPSFTQY